MWGLHGFVYVKVAEHRAQSCFSFEPKDKPLVDHRINFCVIAPINGDWVGSFSKAQLKIIRWLGWSKKTNRVLLTSESLTTTSISQNLRMCGLHGFVYDWIISLGSFLVTSEMINETERPPNHVFTGSLIAILEISRCCFFWRLKLSLSILQRLQQPGCSSNRNLVLLFSHSDSINRFKVFCLASGSFRKESDPPALAIPTIQTEACALTSLRNTAFDEQGCVWQHSGETQN